MPMFRRRPLLRAAVVGGGPTRWASAVPRRRSRTPIRISASAISKASSEHLHRHRQRPWRGGVSAEAAERLQELGKLHEQGILTDEEFSAQKQKILG